MMLAMESLLHERLQTVCLSEGIDVVHGKLCSNNNGLGIIGVYVNSRCMYVAHQVSAIPARATLVTIRGESNLVIDHHVNRAA